MAITKTPTQQVRVVERLWKDLFFGSQTMERGLVQVIPGQRNKVQLNRFYAAANKITAAVATPTTPADALTKDEKTIQAAEIMFYDRFNPKTFNVDDVFLQSIGASVTASAATVLLEAIRDRVTLVFNQDWDNLIWNGDTTSGDAWLSPIDGIVKLIDADGTVVSVTPAGAVTPANVISILESIVAAIPNVVRAMGDMVKIVTTYDIAKAYDEAARALDYKGANIYEAGTMRFAGFEIVPINAIPANRIFAFNTGPGDMAEIKCAVWADSDRFNVKIDRLQADSDEFFIKVNAEVGVNHVYGKQIVEYSPA
jgi:hypothetical protein